MSDSQRHSFTVQASKDVYVGHILALRVDDVAMPNDVVGKREVVEHLGAVAIVALDEENRIVLVNQYRHPVRSWLWELPAGLLDAVDEEPVDAARRELAEETSLRADEWSVLVDVASSPGFSDEQLRVFLARRLSEVPTITATGDEEADMTVERFPLETAVDMVFAGEIVNASTVAGILAAAVSTGHRAGRERSLDTAWPGRPTAFGRRTQS